VKGAVDIGGNVDGWINIGDDIGTNAHLGVGGDLNVLWVGDDVKGAVSVGGDLETLWVCDDVRSAAVIDVAGALQGTHPPICGFEPGGPGINGDLDGSLRAGTLAGSLWIGGDLRGNGLTIVGNADGDISIDGDLQGTLSIGGDATGVIEIGDDIESSAQLAVGGDLAGLSVADNLKTGFAVGGNLSTLDVGGDIRDAAVIDVEGNADRIDIEGDVYGDIYVGDLAAGTGDLGYLESASTPVEEIPDLTDVDYFFYVLGRPEGTLTVGGTIGTLVQV